MLKSPCEGGLDTFLVAGREGIVYFWFDMNAEWKSNIVGYGMDKVDGNPFWGSGSVDVGRMDDDPVGYIAATEVRL